MPDVTRRSVLSGAATALLGGVVGFVVTRNSAAAKERNGTTQANSYGDATSGGAGGAELAAVSAIPDRGGVVVEKVVLTRSGSTVRAFSAVCTHQGCLVDRVTERTIVCPCHSSTFDSATGKVMSGPASKPLPAIDISVRDGKVYSA